MSKGDGNGRVTGAGGAGTQVWREQLVAGGASITAELTMPARPVGWVVIARPAAGPGPATAAAVSQMTRSGLATLALHVPEPDVRAVTGWVHAAVSHIRDKLHQSLPIAYLGGGRLAASGWIAATGGALSGVMAWNGRPGPARSRLESVRVPSLLVVDRKSPSLILLAKGTARRLSGPADVVTGGAAAQVGAGLLSDWYRDRLLHPAPAPRLNLNLNRPSPRRRVASMAVAGALAAAPAGAYAVSAAFAPAVAGALPNFAAGSRLSAADIGGDGQAQAKKTQSSAGQSSGGAQRLSASSIGGDGKEVKAPHDDPPLVDGIGFRWNVNTNLAFSTSSSASGAVSEAGWPPGNPVMASTLNGGTVNQTLADGFDGYNALCLDLNNVGGQCNTANWAVYNQNGPSSLECSSRQVVLPVKTMGNFQVRRKVFVPTNEGFARWLDIVTNTSASAQTVRLQTSNNLGSDSGTRVVTTSDGDATPELTDTWVTTFQNYAGTTSSDPRLGHVLRGLGAPVGLSAINFVDGDDNPFWRYQFVLNPGQTGIIMNFATGQASKAAAATESAALANLSSANALACMTATEQNQVVNFNAGAPNTITTTASAGGQLGAAVSDTATLAGFNSPTGSIVFKLYGPDDNACSAGSLVFTSAPVPVAGNGDYNSGNFTPGAVGTYRWTADYLGDGINPGASSPCNAPNESVTIAATTVTINQAVGQADPTSSSPINFTVTFNTPVTGFTGTDVTFGGSTAAGPLTAVVTPVGPSATYNVAVSGMTSPGTVVASIPANAVTGGNAASTSTDNSVTFQSGDVTAPACAVVAVRRPPGTASGHSEMEVRVTDTQSGLLSITNIAITNGVASVSPSTPFAPGTTQASLTAIKTVEGQPTSFSFDVTDRAGNTRHCA